MRKIKLLLSISIFVVSIGLMGCSGTGKAGTLTNSLTESANLTATTIVEESSTENGLLPFGFNSVEYYNNFTNFASYYNIFADKMYQNDSIISFLAGPSSNQDIMVTLLTNSDGKLLNISIGSPGSESFSSLVNAAISATDMRLDYDELNKSLNFNNPPVSNSAEDTRLYITEGIAFLFTNSGLSIQRDSETQNDYFYTKIHSNTKIPNGPNVQPEDAEKDSKDIANENVSTEFKSALKKAKSYCDSMNMSKAALYDQLTSEFGEKFSSEAAQYAIDNIVADWKENALKKAKNYGETMHMSKAGIYNQLISEYGEKFTEEEAQYAVNNVVIDWKENALEKAKKYRETMDMSPSAIHDQLTSEYGEKFTQEEADYAIANLN